MTEGRAFYMLPMLDYDKYAGVSIDFLIICPDNKEKGRIDREVVSKVERITSFTEGEGGSMFAVVCMNMSEPEELQGWIKGMDGVVDLRMDIMRENIVINKWFDEEIQKRASEIDRNPA